MGKFLTRIIAAILTTIAVGFDCLVYAFGYILMTIMERKIPKHLWRELHYMEGIDCGDNPKETWINIYKSLTE